MIVLGAMSGTSTDGVDVAALSVSPEGEMAYLGLHSMPFDEALRADLLRLQHLHTVYQPDEDPLLLMLQARRQLSEVYAQAVDALMRQLDLKADGVNALGAHGQTLRHRPDLGFTYQMLDASLLAVKLGLTVVHDFRAKDVALGGQGAPLVPAFHQAWLASKGFDSHCAVLNLGGFSNLTVLHGGASSVLGGDCGPANCLMDWWASERFGLPMDEGGEIAAKGMVSQTLLTCLLAHPFFAKAWPKSTGRDDFTAAWLEQCLSQVGHGLADADVMATLLALSVAVIQASLPVDIRQVFICGGGAYNPSFVSALGQALPSVRFSLMDDLGLPAQAVEACAFAWMAAQTVQGQASNCIGVTGASRPAVLGSVQHFF
jgi:anhydro-N-acetylmuramic acid kinase